MLCLAKNDLVALSKNLVVNGGDDSQILFSTSDGATTPGASLINDPYSNSFVVQLNGADRINVGPHLITLNGSVLCGAMTASSATVANALTCGSLTTNEIDLSMPGLSSNIMVNGASRLSFTQLNTRVLGDLEVTGNLSVSGTGGGATLSAPVGSGLTIDGNDILLNHDNSIIAGFDEKVASSGTWNANGNFWDAYYTYPPGHKSFYSSEANATIEFSVQGQTAIMNNLRWHTGAYVDIHGREATTGQYMWLNRVDTYQGGGTAVTHGTVQNPGSYHHAGCIYQILATNLQPGYDRIRITVRKGELLINMLKWLDHRVGQPPAGYVHSDNVHGDPASLSDARLKTEVTPVSGDQALEVLSLITACTYEREDMDQRRLGLIADAVEEAIEQLAIDNVVGTKWHNNDEYKTLQYDRLVPLLLTAVNPLNKQVKDLQSK